MAKSHFSVWFTVDRFFAALFSFSEVLRRAKLGVLFTVVGLHGVGLFDINGIGLYYYLLFSVTVAISSEK
ncbi:MAG: hypothetical protein IJ604_00210 [Prevotella sp.]|nr:hypothetical protein [Prevotella sp.]